MSPHDSLLIEQDVQILVDGSQNGSSFKHSVISRVSELLSARPDRDPLLKDKDKEDLARQSGLVPLAKSLAHSFSHLGIRSAAALLKAQQTALFDEYTDDRKYVMEKVIQV